MGVGGRQRAVGTDQVTPADQTVITVFWLTTRYSIAL